MHGWMKHFHMPSIILAECTQLAKKSTLCLVRKTKNKYYRKMVDNATSQNTWSFHKWTTANRTYISPPLDQGENLTPVVTHSEKCDTLQKHLFPEPPHCRQDNAALPTMALALLYNFILWNIWTNHYIGNYG